MAHSDTLIFLTSVSWVFFCFVVTYFFFVLFFLPVFYKKVSVRTLLRAYVCSSVLFKLVGDLLGSLILIQELLSLYNLNFVKLKFFVEYYLRLVFGSMRVCWSSYLFLAGDSISLNFGFFLWSYLFLCSEEIKDMFGFYVFSKLVYSGFFNIFPSNGVYLSFYYCKK